MTKSFLLAFLLTPFLALTACNKSSSDSGPAATTTGITNGVVTTTNGGYAIVGTMQIYTSCNATVGTISISNYTGSTYGSTYGSTGTPVASAQVTTGGTFNFPVAAGTYTITAQAGSCQVSASGQALTNGQTPYRVCLALSGECNSYSAYKATAASKVSGTIEIPASGNGDLVVQVANIYLSAKKTTSFSLNLDFTSGNNLLNAVPSVAQGWNGSVGENGALKIGNLNADKLSYSAQVDAGLLQFEQGFCEIKATAVAKAADYLKQSGFTAQAITEFQMTLGNSNTDERICVYPQVANIERVVTFKSDAKINSNRVWFVVVSDNQQAAVKKALPGRLAKLATRPKSDGFAGFKKATVKRQIASDNEILADEWAIAQVLVK